METPYQFTPRIPVPPHPTPLSASAYKILSNSKAKRPPLHNPYDKFTQPEFDAWIGDITGALKRALGQIEADDELKILERTQEATTGNATTGYHPIDLDESEDEALNDSFAEINARRLLGKGKARDPREGPGLGGTDRTKPIEIVSSDEEEEHEVEELAIGVENDEDEEYEEDEEEEEEEEEDYSEQEDYSWKLGESSSQQLFLPAKRRIYIQEEEESEGDDFEDGYEEDPIDDEEQLEDELEYDVEEYDMEAVIQPPTQHTFSPTSRLARRALPIPADAEFISIDDSDEETGLEDQESITLGPPKFEEVESQELQHGDVDEQSMEREQSVEVDEIVKEDTVYVHEPIPPFGSAPSSDADIATWSLLGSSNQQDAMDYESLYENIEAATTVQPEEQAEVISSLVDWNYPPAFPAGIPTSGPGHLATPSSEESNAGSAVQTPDSEINSPKPVDEESSPHLLVHEEEITQTEKDLDNELVKNAETLVDQVTLSIPEPALVEDPELQSSSQTLITDPSPSYLLFNGIAEHGEGVMAEETVQEHKIDAGITSEDVTLVDENELAPSQQSLEDTVGDEIESGDVDTPMQETKIIDVNGPSASAVLNSHIAAANAEDDISPLAEGIDEHMDNQFQSSASTSSVQIPVLVYHPYHTHDYDQLPTPPPDQSPTTQSPSVANDPSHTQSFLPRRHRVEIEEVQDEDDVRPQPFWADSAELDLRFDIESTGALYTVVEPEPNNEYTDEDVDADGEIDFDVDVVSMSGASQMWDEAQSKDGEMQLPMNYVVEEPLTDGRLTEEPGDRAASLGVVSVEAEESEAHDTNHETGAIALFSTVEEPVPLDYEVSSQADTNIQPRPSSNPDPEEPTGSRKSPTLARHIILDSVSSTVEHDVPMPVIANANVVDPTSCPGTPSHQRASPLSAALDEQSQAQQASGDGLFTPADESITVTSANIHCHVLDELARVFFGTPIVSSTPVEEFSPVLSADPMSDLGLVVIDDRAIEEIEAPVQLPPIGTEAMHTSGAHPSEDIQAETSPDSPISLLPPDPAISTLATLTRKSTDPILVSDPYPYSLSTPGVDPTEEDSEQDNSMSSNSTLEKDLEDKDTNSILDDTDELELQYPPQLGVLAELKGPAAAKGEDASKIVDEVAIVDAHTDFDPESVVTRLPQSSAEVQPTNLPTVDSTVAPGLINGVEKDDIQGGILPIEPANGISSEDFSLAQIANHDLPESSTTPSNGITGTPVSTRASKRKREQSLPPFEKVAETTADKAEKGKNRKVSKLDGERDAKDSNQGLVDQTTSQATIHVKPRRKTQSVESVASRAPLKRTSEAKTTSHSSSGASATYKIISRSSSVASSTLSDQSVAVVVPPSPTVHKPNARPVQTSPKPVSLLHAHGQKRNNQNKQPRSSPARPHPIQPPMPSIQRVISLPRIKGLGSILNTSPTAAISPTVATSPTRAAPPVAMKADPSPAVRHSPAISSSPITRSHCRYHRISLPKEEGGPRVCFLVPGCSLNDGKLMVEEEIEDHGDATQEDSLRMIKDIESLDFDSYLIGILRQLVGLDILREQEVFYLPQAGEEVVRKFSPRKERSGVFRGADSSSYAGSPGYSGSTRSPTSMKAPTSLADSTSTSFSAFRRRLDSEKDSVSVYIGTESELSDGEHRDSKGARPSSPDKQGAGPMAPPPKVQGKRHLKSRRSMQIEGVHEGDSNDAQSRIGRKKLSSRPGIKRRRDSEITTKDDDEEPKSKKIKMRTRSSMS